MIFTILNCNRIQGKKHLTQIILVKEEQRQLGIELNDLVPLCMHLPS